MILLVPLALIIAVACGIIWIGEQLLPLDLPAKPPPARPPSP